MSTYSEGDSPIPVPDQGGYTLPTTSGETSDNTSRAKDKAATAKDAAAGVAGDAQDATKHVAGVTKDQAGAVASEVKSQARDLFDQTSSQLKEQAGTQQQKVAEGLRSVSDELSSMADNSSTSGVASELVRNLSGRAGSAAGWLDGRDPGSLVQELKSFAARKPGTFIAVAAGAGILAGRLAKSLAAEAKTHSSSDVAGPTSEAAPRAEAQSQFVAPVVPSPTPTSTPPAPATAVRTPTFDEVVEGAPSTQQRFDGDVR